MDTSADWVRAACEASLRRLDVATIDLYYVHRRNPAVPIEETVGAMADLVGQGKVRWLGLSEVSLATVGAAHAVHPITAVQAQAALAWVLARGDDIVAIPGTRRLAHVEENVAAADFELTPEQVERLTAAVPAGAVAGERYPLPMMRAVGH